jgi:hypothetical protein
MMSFIAGLFVGALLVCCLLYPFWISGRLTVRLQGDNERLSTTFYAADCYVRAKGRIARALAYKDLVKVVLGDNK